MADEETKTEVTETVEAADKNEGILDYIKKAWRGDDTSETVDTSEETNTESKTFERTEETPKEFVEAAEADGWTADDIAEFAADKTDEELLELLPSLIEEEEVDIEEEEPAEEPAKEEKSEDIEALKSSMKEELLKEVLAELGPKFETLDDFKQDQNRRQIFNDLATADKILDGASKDFPELGEYEKMPKFTTGSRKGQLIPTSKEFKARAEVFDMAVALRSAGRSNSMEDAMADALAWYRGKHGQKQTERKVIRNLKAHEKKLSGARTGKETKREYNSTRDEVIDFIRQQQKALGTDT